MKPASNNAPVFALDDSTDWDDLDNVMEVSAEYQSQHFGRIIPLMFFAPMTEPENLDAWVPMKTLPERLFIVSIERSADATLMKAFAHAEADLGEVQLSASCPAVRIDFEEPFAHVYEQMEAAGIAAYASPQPGRDDASFFFIRGLESVRAFDAALRAVTASKRS
ncbi:MAG: hypothetical protein IPK22_05255 [Verrucomicrobiaceae bacterium]|nr:hypothetical protein [Verrucomicrobiaceae bacterium]